MFTKQFFKWRKLLRDVQEWEVSRNEWRQREKSDHSPLMAAFNETILSFSAQKIISLAHHTKKNRIIVDIHVENKTAECAEEIDKCDDGKKEKKQSTIENWISLNHQIVASNARIIVFLSTSFSFHYIFLSFSFFELNRTS